MTLSKLELQQMLREMNVKFNAAESYEELRQRLQKENHSLWLKSMAEGRTAGGKSDKIVVRKRKNEPLQQDVVPGATSSQQKSDQESQLQSRPEAVRQKRPAPLHHRHAIEKPAPGKPWKEAADGTEPFNRKKKVFESVLRRSNACCENCGSLAVDASGQANLEPFHIVPLDQGGEHSIKNVVALCPACLKAVQSDPDPKAIKELKRKTRTKLYDALEVVHKRKPGRRKG